MPFLVIFIIYLDDVVFIHLFLKFPLIFKLLMQLFCLFSLHIFHQLLFIFIFKNFGHIWNCFTTAKSFSLIRCWSRTWWVFNNFDIISSCLQAFSVPIWLFEWWAWCVAWSTRFVLFFDQLSRCQAGCFLDNIIRNFSISRFWLISFILLFFTRTFLLWIVENIFSWLSSYCINSLLYLKQTSPWNVQAGAGFVLLDHDRFWDLNLLQRLFFHNR